jgi:hypothetical protein
MGVRITPKFWRLNMSDINYSNLGKINYYELQQIEEEVRQENLLTMAKRFKDLEFIINDTRCRVEKILIELTNLKFMIITSTAEKNQ